MSVIRVGHIALGFHDASARVVESVLERHGHRVERSAVQRLSAKRQVLIASFRSAFCAEAAVDALPDSANTGG